MVKAVLALNGDALYFSRAALPFVREAGRGGVRRWAHLGLYGYRRDTLLRLATPAAHAAGGGGEAGAAARAGARHPHPLRPGVQGHTVAVDVPEDVASVEAVMRERGL